MLKPPRGTVARVFARRLQGAHTRPVHLGAVAARLSAERLLANLQLLAAGGDGGAFPPELYHYRSDVPRTAEGARALREWWLRPDTDAAPCGMPRADVAPRWAADVDESERIALGYP